MTGTLVNTGTVLLGSLIGLTIGKRMPARVKDILMQSLGLVTFFFGIRMCLVDGKSANALMAAGCVILGGLTGELLCIEQHMERLAEKLKKALNSGSPRFVEGFVTSSVLYLTGPMAILGCLTDGLSGDASTLYIKSLLDGVASIALASTLGVGVIFSALSVLLVQGGITLAASWLTFAQNPEILASIAATGGVLIMGIGLILLDIKRIRTGNMLPALAYAVMFPLLF